MSHITSKLVPSQISQLFKQACIAELEAIKPGNVHIFSDGHNMTVQQFIQSAEAVAAVIALPHLTLGERILLSVQATQEAVACNTNLGIILLCAPLVHAALMPSQHDLESNLHYVLQHTSVEDATQTFKAINLAQPGGLGQAQEHDVRYPANCTLLQAMQVAQHRDLIAAQYHNDFDAIFNVALPILHTEKEGKKLAWLTTEVYLTLLSTFADSHIVRKQGEIIAQNVQQQAAEHLTIQVTLSCI